ncbi:flagellar FlbD family protein [Acidothermus cellulolyticus 11B]|uniref:Flagellar FlbD family protein n=1 Tax=Acidothermus cellulolyticus (strain ATCC 43068 / DSM 8971 / 11B) TaxID=351607 RepID=A0LT63_ACIC1|nr:flagellar FlbD family protein [Acidothermus cellulolyticus]ABK52623.1 flagellar FlbD family protein [Acidothermus cellulolyticus 11B]MCL6550659.1 flagellar FlbD family protein [Acidothermus cellulolyticus]
MIVVTRLNGPPFALNPDLIERIDATPDTVVTLVDGVKYVVAESVEEVVARIREYRGQVLAAAYAFERTITPTGRGLRVIRSEDTTDTSPDSDENPDPTPLAPRPTRQRRRALDGGDS